jgi:asparagine synthase (glutamine-hydrolysing)
LRGEDVKEKILSMLETLNHRGPDRVAVATEQEISTAKKLNDISLSNKLSATAIGHNYLNISGAKREIFSQSDRFTIMGWGNIYGEDGEDKEDAHIESFLLNRLEDVAKENMKNVLKDIMNDFQGEYVFTILQGDRIFAARDMIGARPLYVGSTTNMIGLASERKALWRIGLTKVIPLPPGHIASFTRAGVNIQPASNLRKNPAKYTSTQRALEEAWRRIYQACLSRVRGISKVGVLFSGGLDSSFLASLLQSLGVNVILYTSALEGESRIESVEQAAQQLGLKHRVREFTVNDVEEHLAQVLYAIERSHVIDAGVALPFYFSSVLARKDGLKVIFSGQGCDEIFGGYARYLRILSYSGYQGLQRALWSDAAGMGSRNLERDDASVMINSVELQSPFTDVRVVKQALEIPPQLKVLSPNDKLRKHILRKLAEKVGLPKSVVESPKKAAQYSSGSERALRMCAKKRGADLTTFLDEMLRREVAVRMS